MSFLFITKSYDESFKYYIVIKKQKLISHKYLYFMNDQMILLF